MSEAPALAVRAIVIAINDGDPQRILAAMTAPFRFVDALGAVIEGEGALTDAWRHYFALVPDYRIELDEILAEGDVVLATGRASGTVVSEDALRDENHWSTPAAWRAVVRDGRVSEWRVYADNEPIRAILRRPGPAA